MAPLLGCIADDFTGATDLAGMLVKHGMRTIQIIGVPDAPLPDDIDAILVMKIGRLPLIPYHQPGDPALGEAIRGLAGRHSAVLLTNHSPVVSGKDLEAALYAAEELEETAKLFLLLGGAPISPLNGTQIDELRQAFELDL